MSLLDPDLLAHAQSLGLFARQIVEGPTAGENRSPFHGFSVEFTQHRQYAPGDDLRHLDWKIVARTDRLFIKRYQQETNCHVQILLDASESMAYGEGETQKLEYARKLAACLAYLVLKQRDQVSLRLFDTTVSATIPKTANLGSIAPILNLLVRARPTGQTGLAGVLHEVAAARNRRGIVILLSDLLVDDEEPLIEGVRHLAFQGHEVILFHTLHGDELRFELPGPIRFDALEREESIAIDPADIRDDYLRQVRAFCDRVRDGCTHANCHYVLHDTGRPLREALGAYLAFRRGLSL